MKTVSIWAPLRYANYGDDMQAIAFAIMIKKMGYFVKVFQLEESLAARYDLTIAHTVDDLCKDVNLCIIAGGALLTPFKWYVRLLSKNARQYEKDFVDLYNQTKLHPNLKFCAISFGGDGVVREIKPFFGKGRRLLFKSPAFLDGTVRLEGDVDMMKTFGKNMTYYPDMLFKSLDYFDPKKLPATKKYRVGFNFKKRHVDKQLIADILAYAETHDDMEFHFTTTHMVKTGIGYQYVPERESKNVFIDHYESPDQLLGVIGSMDCFMTSMLHMGLTGLVVKTPFISYRGPGKTKTFLKSIGGDWAIMSPNITFDELKNNVWNQTRETLYNRYNVSEINTMIEGSIKQYEFCRNIVEKFA